jgi:hypothetical protein
MDYCAMSAVHSGLEVQPFLVKQLEKFPLEDQSPAGVLEMMSQSRTKNHKGSSFFLSGRIASKG